MLSTAKNDRNSGLDFLRIIAMCGIIMLHMLGQGGVLHAKDPDQIQYWIAWWVEIVAYCSVDVFALLSGYLGIFRKKDSVYRILELIVTIAFYSIIITVLFGVFMPGSIEGVKSLIGSLCPPLIGRYWYITCYIPLAFFAPYINKALLSLTEHQHKMLCILILVLFSVVPSLCHTDFFVLKQGYSFAWLFTCYIIGAYIKRTKFSNRFLNIWLFAGFSFVLLFGNILGYLLFGRNIQYCISYTSPFVLAMAVVLLVQFERIKAAALTKILIGLSAAAFDVYIIHCHVLIYDKLFLDNFKWIADLPLWVIPIAVVIIAAIIYLLLSIIGRVRIWFFKLLHVNNLIKRVSEKMDSILYQPTE